MSLGHFQAGSAGLTAKDMGAIELYLAMIQQYQQEIVRDSNDACMDQAQGAKNALDSGADELKHAAIQTLCQAGAGAGANLIVGAYGAYSAKNSPEINKGDSDLATINKWTDFVKAQGPGSFELRSTLPDGTIEPRNPLTAVLAREDQPYTTFASAQETCLIAKQTVPSTSSWGRFFGRTSTEYTIPEGTVVPAYHGLSTTERATIRANLFKARKGAQRTRDTAMQELQGNLQRYNVLAQTTTNLLQASGNLTSAQGQAANQQAQGVSALLKAESDMMGACKNTEQSAFQSTLQETQAVLSAIVAQGQVEAARA